MLNNPRDCQHGLSLFSFCHLKMLSAQKSLYASLRLGCCPSIGSVIVSYNFFFIFDSHMYVLEDLRHKDGLG